MNRILKELCPHIRLKIDGGHFNRLVFSCTRNVHSRHEVRWNKIVGSKLALLYQCSHLHMPQTTQRPQILYLAKALALSSALAPTKVRNSEQQLYTTQMNCNCARIVIADLSHKPQTSFNQSVRTIYVTN